MLSCLLLCATLAGCAEAIPHLCVSEWNRPTLVRRQLKLIHASLEMLITGGVGLTPLINVWSRGVFLRHTMLHFYSAYCATLMPDWAESFLTLFSVQPSAWDVYKPFFLTKNLCPKIRSWRSCNVNSFLFNKITFTK